MDNITPIPLPSGFGLNPGHEWPMPRIFYVWFLPDVAPKLYGWTITQLTFPG